MSILDNEGHDPNGLGNRPSRTDNDRLFDYAEQTGYLMQILRMIATIDPARGEYGLAQAQQFAKSALARYEQNGNRNVGKT